MLHSATTARQSMLEMSMIFLLKYTFCEENYYIRTRTLSLTHIRSHSHAQRHVEPRAAVRGLQETNKINKRERPSSIHIIYAQHIYKCMPHYIYSIKWESFGYHKKKLEYETLFVRPERQNAMR